MNKCSICGKSHPLFTLELEEDGQKYTKLVCGSCWDVIAAIAEKVARKILAEEK